MATEEEERQYEVARQFIELHPEYKGKAEDADAMLTWMEMRDMKMTLDGLEIAYKALFCGEPEPKVMSPDLFFQKVKPTQHIPKVHLPSAILVFAGDQKTNWKPISTGINGATTVSTGATWPEDVIQQIVKGADKEIDWEWDDPAEVKVPVPEPENKPVASMPSTWYSDVVPVQTTRRIKDDD